MILTKLDRMIIDDYPSDIAKAIEYFCAHKSSIATQTPDNYIVNENITYSTFISTNKDNILSQWESHTCSTVHIILEGEEIMDVSDIDDLTPSHRNSLSPYIQYHQGFAQTRIRLQPNNVVILFPEDACRQSYDKQNPVKKCIFYVKIIP